MTTEERLYESAAELALAARANPRAARSLAASVRPLAGPNGEVCTTPGCACGILTRIVALCEAAAKAGES